MIDSENVVDNNEINKNVNDDDNRHLHQVKVPDSTTKENDRDELSIATHDDQNYNTIENVAQSIKTIDVVKSQKNKKTIKKHNKTNQSVKRVTRRSIKESLPPFKRTRSQC